MSRVTDGNVYSAFILLANRLNKTVYIGESTLKGLRKRNKYFHEPKLLAEKYLTVGSWSLGYSGWGWQIEEMSNEDGGISHPLGLEAKKSREFYDCVHFALRTLDYKRLSEEI